MPALRILAVLTLPLGLLVACSDDDDGGGEGAAPDRAADQALADAVVLRLEDLGAGWSPFEDDEDDDESDDETDKALADCLRIDPALLVDDDDEISADETFDREQGRLESSVEVVPTVDEAARDFEILEGDRFADCYGDLLDEELRKDAEADEDAQDAGVTYEGVEMARLDLPAGLGDEAVGYRATISISAGTVPFNSYADFVFVRRDRVEMTLSLLTNFQAQPVEYAVQLAATMDGRAARA